MERSRECPSDVWELWEGPWICVPQGFGLIPADVMACTAMDSCREEQEQLLTLSQKGTWHQFCLQGDPQNLFPKWSLVGISHLPLDHWAHRVFDCTWDFWHKHPSCPLKQLIKHILGNRQITPLVLTLSLLLLPRTSTTMSRSSCWTCSCSTTA